MTDDDELERRMDSCEITTALLKEDLGDIEKHLSKQDRLLWFIFTAAIGGIITWLVFHV